jgi:hypothetical protein
VITSKLLYCERIQFLKAVQAYQYSISHDGYKNKLLRKNHRWSRFDCMYLSHKTNSSYKFNVLRAVHCRVLQFKQENGITIHNIQNGRIDQMVVYILLEISYNFC